MIISTMLTASSRRRRKRGPYKTTRTIPIKVVSGKKRRPVPSFTRPPRVSSIRKSYHRSHIPYLQEASIHFGNVQQTVQQQVNNLKRIIRRDRDRDLRAAKTEAQKRRVREIYRDIENRALEAIYRGDIGGVV